jgi:hypothetical protein
MTKQPTPTIDVLDPDLPRKLKNMKSPVDEAKAVIADLERQRDALNKRRAEHNAERRKIAYAARAQGDKEASARLSDMNSLLLQRLGKVPPHLG